MNAKKSNEAFRTLFRAQTYLNVDASSLEEVESEDPALRAVLTVARSEHPAHDEYLVNLSFSFSSLRTA